MFNFELHLVLFSLRFKAMASNLFGDAMLCHWVDLGIRFGYPFPLAPDHFPSRDMCWEEAPQEFILQHVQLSFPHSAGSALHYPRDWENLVCSWLLQDERNPEEIFTLLNFPPRSGQNHPSQWHTQERASIFSPIPPSILQLLTGNPQLFLCPRQPLVCQALDHCVC